MDLPSAQTLLEAADAGRTLTPTERGRDAQGACGPTFNSRSDPTTGPPGGAVTGFNAGFDAAESEAQALAVQDEIIALRRARGERTVGYKIGFTNRTIWPLYGVHQPIWGPVWNTSLHRLAGAHVDITLAALAEPRLEPEIVIGLRHSPPPDANARTPQSLRRLIDCVEWVAPGFEIVHSIWPGWQFNAPQAIAAQGLHGALYVGPAIPIAQLGDAPATALSSLTLHLFLDGAELAKGVGANVLDGPLQALGHLVAGLAQRGARIPAGSVVTTGTLTDAQPLVPGQRWSTRIEGAPLSGLTLDVAQPGPGR
jgi:2-oxo-3-hexenedioate decarboxylase